MKTRPSFRLCGLMFALGLASLAQAATVSTIFSPSSGLLFNWSATTWGNLDVHQTKSAALKGGAVSLLVSPAANAASYAGVTIVVEAIDAIDLSDTLRTQGEVHLRLRNSRGQDGIPAPEQKIQVMLSFQPDGAKPINGRYEQVLLEPASTDESDGWQLVKISIPAQLASRPAPGTPVALRGIYLQYIDQPLAGFFIGSCTLEDSTKVGTKK